MAAWLRRVLRRPPTIADCIRAALRAPCEPRNKSERDPYAGVVTGPDLAARTAANHQKHVDRYGDDAGFPVTVWGPFVNPYTGHVEGGDAA